MADHERIFREVRRETGIVGMRGDPRTLTCGRCSSVGGPALAVTRRRHHILCEGGIVVPGL